MSAELIARYIALQQAKDDGYSEIEGNMVQLDHQTPMVYGSAWPESLKDAPFPSTFDRSGITGTTGAKSKRIRFKATDQLW